MQKDREAGGMENAVYGKRKRDTINPGRGTGRSLPGTWETGSPGEESPNSAGQCAG